MKIGIMGGTFNPIHNAHLIIARYAMEQYSLDKVIFMTGGNPPHKSGVLDKHMRHKMTALAAGDEFEISSYEVDKEEYSYTVHTLEHFANLSDRLFFIIGEDSLEDIGKWYKPERILELCTLLVFPRKSKESLDAAIGETRGRFGGEILPIVAPIFGLSSSEIRRRIHEGKSVKHMLPDSVLDFIIENNLYK